MQSVIQKRGHVHLPKFNGDRFHMIEFFKGIALPAEVKRWQCTVDQMLESIDVDGPMYLMVDQTFVKAGTPQRRPGLHIDGYWHKELSAHGGGHIGGSGGSHTGGSHRSIKADGRHGGHSAHSGKKGWDFSECSPKDDWDPEPILLVSNISACAAYVGEYFDFPKEGGDCSHIDASKMDKVVLEPDTVYAANVTCLHESLPVPVDCLRTIVRINVPNWAFS